MFSSSSWYGRRWFWVAALGTLLHAFSASAQHAEAWGAALEQGRWDDAVALASATLEQGSCSRAELTAAQRTLAIANAQLGNDAQARRAFVWLLALDPTYKLSPDAPVEVRSPYMEARGFWSLHPTALGAAVELASDGSRLMLVMTDPARLAQRVLVRLRSGVQGAFVERAFVPEESLTIPLTLPLVAGELEYTVSYLDEHANVFWQLGSESQPARVRAPGVVPVVAANPSTPRGEEHVLAPSPRPYYLGATAAFVVGGAALAAAGVLHHERQVLAQQWNAGDCDGSGQTRGEICARQHREIQTYQRAALGLYAAGGVSVLTGAILLLVAPRKAFGERVDTVLRCGSGPGLIGLGCAQAF